MYRRTRPSEGLFAIALLAFAAFWTVVFSGSIAIKPAAPGSQYSNKKPTDVEIRRYIVGSWIVPSEFIDGSVSGTGAVETKSVEVFGPNGSGGVYFYSDAACTLLARTILFSWSVQDGVLNYLIENGTPSRDDVVSIDDKNMVLRSMEQNIVNHRRKAINCASF
jgi:hypothetical protein